MGGRVALAAALTAAAVAVRQGSSAAISTAAASGSSNTCVSTDASLVTAPLRAGFVARASSHVARASPGTPTAPLFATAPRYEHAAGFLSSLWPRARSASRRRCRVLQQVLAAGAFGLGKALSWGGARARRAALRR